MPETNPPESPSMRELSAWMQQLSMQLQDRKQRQVLSIRGDATWCDTMFPVIKSGHPDALVLSERIAGHRTLAFNRVETLLGSEASMVIVDLFTGLNPDLLCIASGLISCGGLLVLLSPEIEHYSQIEDRYGVWQDNAMSENPVFAEYIFNSIQNMPASGYSLIQGKALPCIADLPQAQPTALISGKTSEQTGILAEINNWLLDRQQSIALIEADRGRGKSTCLGFIVRSLILSQQMSVIVTAHSRQAAAILLQQANEQSKKVLEFDFFAPDRLIAEAKHAQVLIIDEAAMLPYPMLQQLCNFYPKVIMATTTGGYEGTGQGFLLRFIARLPDDQLRRFKLNAPVRWASSDCLEAWLKSEKPRTLPKSKIGKAIRYAERLWPRLLVYLDDGRLPFENNAAERAIKPVVIGRKNWRFTGSDDGGRRTAVVCTFIESCRRNGVEPFAYLRHLLEVLPGYRGNVADLTPLAYKAAVLVAEPQLQL